MREEAQQTAAAAAVAFAFTGGLDCDPADSSELKARSEQAQQTVAGFVARGIVQPDPVGMPTATRFTLREPYETAYAATDFTHFSAAEMARFLGRAEWTQEGQAVPADALGSAAGARAGAGGAGGAGTDGRTINYVSQVQFARTVEDVSAIYGNALPYMLQWETDGFCPNVERIVCDGMLCFNPNVMYSNRMVGQQVRSGRAVASASAISLWSSFTKTGSGRNVSNAQTEDRFVRRSPPAAATTCLIRMPQPTVLRSNRPLLRAVSGNTVYCVFPMLMKTNHVPRQARNRP